MITIDESLLAPIIKNTAKLPVTSNIKATLKTDIPESWNGLHGDITKDPIAQSLM